jgi:hypothetical protein
MAGPDNDRCHVPDTLIGIGKAGKEVVYSMLDQEWIQQRVIDSRDKNDQFEAFVVDTAMEEKGYDEDVCTEINAEIKDRAMEEFTDRPDSPIVQNDYVHYINTIEGTDSEYTDPDSLTTGGPAGRIVQASGVKSWWLRKSETGDNVILRGDNSYSDGVFRRRALSKALFHASETGTPPLEEAIDAAGRGDKAYIVVGIGGGTGSGMFIDLAKEINQRGTNIYLFGILPGTDEKQELRANAHAALSELEYLSLQGAGLFNNVVLFPVEEAKNRRKLGGFDEAIAQSIMAHRNLTNNEWNKMDTNTAEGAGRYAPFTIGIPHILRYNAGDLQEAREQVLEWMEEKSDDLETELTLYSQLRDYIINQFDEPGTNLEAALNRDQEPNSDLFNLDRDRALDLKERLDDLQDLLDNDVFDDLDMKPAIEWRKQIQGVRENAKESAPSDADRADLAEEIVTKVPRIHAHAEQTPAEKWEGEESYRKLEHVIRGELEAIQNRTALYKTAHLFEDEELKQALRSALDEEEDGPAFVSDTRSELARINNEIDEEEDKLAYLEDIEETLAGQNGLHQEHLREWRNRVREDVDALVSIDEHGEEIRALLDNLEDDMTNAVAKINGANSEDELPSNPLSFDEFDGLNYRLKQVGMGPINEQTVRVSLDALREAKEAWLKSSSGFLSGIFGGDDMVDDYERALQDIDSKFISVNNPFKDNVNVFKCDFVGDDLFEDMVSEVETKHNDLLEDVVQSFRTAVEQREVSLQEVAAEIDELEVDYDKEEMVESGPQVVWPGSVDTASYVDELRSILRGDLSTRSTDAILSELTNSGGVVYRGIREGLFAPVREEKEAIDRRIRELSQRQQQYEQIMDIIQGAGSAYAREVDHQATRRIGDIYGGIDESEPLYIKRVSPGDNKKLLRPDDIKEAEFWGETEQAFIERQLQEFARLDSKKLPIEQREIRADGRQATADQESTYKQHRIAQVYMSRMFETEQQDFNSDVLDNVERDLRDQVYLLSGEDGYADRIVGYGGEWDVSMTTFVTGVMLDNLSPFVLPPNGYLRSYHNQKGQLIDDILVRHTYGLDGNDERMFQWIDNGREGDPPAFRGAYTYRERTFDLNDESNKQTIINSTEQELRNLILDEYLGFEEVESTFDIDEITN